MKLSSAGKPDKRPSIFIVDDNPAMRDSLEVYLSMKGMDVRTYESAEAFLRDGESCNANLLVVDVNLPGMDGFELLDNLKSRMVEIPAVMISGRFAPEMRERARSAGIVSLIEKPIDHRRLIDAINTGLRTA
jgi:two-component system response regulator FixJ